MQYFKMLCRDDVLLGKLYLDFSMHKQFKTNRYIHTYIRTFQYQLTYDVNSLINFNLTSCFKIGF